MRSIDVETARGIILEKEVDCRILDYNASEIIAFTGVDPSIYQLDSHDGGRSVTFTIGMRLFHQALLGIYGDLSDVRYTQYDSFDENTRMLLTGGHVSLKDAIEKLEKRRVVTSRSWMLENPISGRQILLRTSSGSFSDIIRQIIWSFDGIKGREARR